MHDPSVTRWTGDLKSDDRQLRDEAARQIWDHYVSRLSALARNHLADALRRRQDEDDILQSVFKSFCCQQQTTATFPANRHELFAILIRMTLRKDEVELPPIRWKIPDVATN